LALDPEAVARRVHRFIETRELLRPGLVLVAVSGGQDSICMLDLLRRLQGDLGIGLHVAHLNHSFRGAQADAEAESVRDLADRWQLPATVAKVDVPAYRARYRLSRQVAARHARYQFLAGLAGRLGAEQVAVGHTADDAIESLLINLLRGAGLAGLRGILPSRRIAPGQLGPGLAAADWRIEPVPAGREPLPRVVRPLLELSRAETEGYCLSTGLAFQRDPSNQDPSYRRSWVRTQLLPLLERQVPDVRERLSGAADLLAGDYALIAGLVDEAWSRLARVERGSVEIPLADWSSLDLALRRHLLRRAVEEVAGSLEEIGRVHVDAMEAAVREGSAGSRLDLPGGVRLERGYQSFRVAGRGAARPAGGPMPREAVPLPVPGRVDLPGGVLEAEVVERVGEGIPCAGDPWETCLDAGRAGVNLLVRGRRPGDRFVPLGMERPKKLHDFMVDEKIPREERDRAPVVTTLDGDIAWVAGHRLDERFKVTPETRRILRLRYVPR
jgi:tRNA(Ile)-lysidine synthase